MAYIVPLFVCTLSAGPVLDPQAIVAPHSKPRAAAPHFAAPIGMDVPEPATYIIVGTVLIGFSIIVHVLRRRRSHEIAQAADEATVRDRGASV